MQRPCPVEMKWAILDRSDRSVRVETGVRATVIRVAIADDHPIVRRGLLDMIALEPDMKPVVEAATAKELLEGLAQHRCDVAIVDIQMPDRSGLEVLEDIWRMQPAIRVLVLSVYPASQFAARAIRAGASGYLTKESAPEELVRAIRTTAAGRRHINPAAAEALASAVQTEGRPSAEDALSPREIQVLRLYASGKTVSEIAFSLGLSLRTVSTYKSRVLEKLGLSNNADLIAYAIRNGMI